MLPFSLPQSNQEVIISRALFKRVLSEMVCHINHKKAISFMGEQAKGHCSAQYALTEKLIDGEHVNALSCVT